MKIGNMKRKYFTVGIFNLIILLFIAIFFITNANITGFAVLDFASYRLYIFDAYQGKDVSFVIPIDNGAEEIESAYAEISIFDLDENEVAFLKSSEIKVFPNEKTELKMIWKGSGIQENYQARIIIFNDNESYSFSKNFKLEREILTFESVVVKDFVLGEVVNFSVVLQNHLDENLSNVSVSILILDEYGNTLSEIISETKDIQENSISQLQIIWDTEGIKPNRYNAKMIINYGENFIDRDLIIDIADGNFNIIGVGYSISNEPTKTPNNNTTIFLLVGLLIIVNVAWVIYYIKSKTKLKTKSKT